MRVSEIDLYTNDVEFITISLDRVSYTDKFIAKAVAGLDVDEINPRFYGFGADGTKFHEYTRSAREIVLRIVLNPNYALNETFSDIRDELYRAISSNRFGEVKLIFKSGASSLAQIFGRIIKFEVAHMSNVPELQITIKCDDPILRGITPVNLNWVNSPSLPSPFEITDALSTSPHGFTMAVNYADDSLTGIIIRDPDSNWVFEVEWTFLAGDVLHVSTEYGNKYLYVDLSGGGTYNLMDKITTESFWPILFPGLNEWVIEDTTDIYSVDVSYKPAYWGV